MPVAKDDRTGEVGGRDCINVNEVGELQDEAELELPVPVVLAEMVLERMEEVISILLEFVCLKGTVRGIVPIPGRPVFVVVFEFAAEEAVPARNGKPSSLVSTGLSLLSSILGSSSTCITSKSSSGESGSVCSSPSTIVMFTPFPLSFTFILPFP